MDFEFLHMLARDLVHCGSGTQKFVIFVRERTAVRHFGVAVFCDHGKRALGQIADVVGKVRVAAVHHRFMAIGAVGAVRHFATEEIADRIDAIGVGQREGVDDIADGLRHLLAAVMQEAVSIDALRQFDTGGHEHGGPDDRVEADDVLADDMGVGGPEFLEELAVGVGIADAGDVVRQRVEPDIHDVLGVAWHFDAPVELFARTRNGEVRQAAFDEGHDFIAPMRRLNEVRVLFIVFEQPVLIGGHAEEIGFIFHPLNGRAGGRELFAVFALGELVFAVEGFVAHRVPARIGTQIDVGARRAAFVGGDGFPDRLTGLLVAFFDGADEVVVGGVEPFAHGLELRGHFVGEFLSRDAARLGGLNHLLAVVIDAREEMNVIAVEPLEARDHVGRDQLIGMADMWRAIGIGNGRGDVKAWQLCRCCRCHVYVNLAEWKATMRGVMRLGECWRARWLCFPTSRIC